LHNISVYSQALQKSRKNFCGFLSPYEKQEFEPFIHGLLLALRKLLMRLNPDGVAFVCDVLAHPSFPCIFREGLPW